MCGLLRSTDRSIPSIDSFGIDPPDQSVSTGKVQRVKFLHPKLQPLNLKIAWDLSESPGLG